MEHKLSLLAVDRTGQKAVCTFKAVADGIALATNDEREPVFVIPAGTSTVDVTVKPSRPIFWEETFSVTVGTGGSLTVAAPAFQARVQMTVAATPAVRFTLAIFKVSQFRDRTDHAVELLSHTPTKRSFLNMTTGIYEDKDVDELKSHKATYGAWPPEDWELEDMPAAHFLDAVNPLKSGALNFTQVPPLQINVDSVVLERAGVRMVPRYFAVTWPQDIAPREGAAPTPFLFYFRQANKYNLYKERGVFVGTGLAPYPENFDYADSGMFESLHYARSPLFNPGSKGVPYQVAKAGANVVTVIPCNSYEENFGDLADPEDAETVLLELQAFMFWRGRVATPPASVGKTAIAAFSSGNFFLNNWLKDATKRNGRFLSKVVTAVYFLEPMRRYELNGKRVEVLDEIIASALQWAAGGVDKRIRLYMQFTWPSLKKLMDKPLPDPPFFATSADRRRTVSVVTNSTWAKAFRRPIKWVVVHHAVAATMLTHALAQKDV
ncbi:MAG: hypothetical protein ABI051_03930 [Vicinamibacterales bacterium]